MTKPFPAATVPESWRNWLERGWHGVRVADWVTGYMYPNLQADLAFLDTLKSDDLARAAQRPRRNVVEDLLRFQHMMPWDSGTRAQFFREVPADDALLSDKEHALPIGQLKSLVLMALDTEGDIVEAERRLLFAWLCPTVRCTRETHSALTRGEKRWCQDFNRPLSCYNGIKLLRWDGVAVPAEDYAISDLLADLCRISAIEPLIARLEGLRMPTFAEERSYTAATTQRKRSQERTV